MRFAALTAGASLLVGCNVQQPSQSAADTSAWAPGAPTWAANWAANTWRRGAQPPFLAGFKGDDEFNDPSVPVKNDIFTPEALERYNDVREKLGQGLSIYDPDALCHPPGMPAQVAAILNVFRVAIAPDRIVMLFNNGLTYRNIYTDGRSLPEDPELTYMGHSVGHWEGDTLVVQSNGMRSENTQIEPGLPHSDQFRMTERWHPISNEEIEVTLTYEDPLVFKHPVDTTIHYVKTTEDRLREAFCVDGNRYVKGPHGELTLTREDGSPLPKAED
ncbi:MAG: hypothetical protein QM696_12610 [Steroidobacteraceae bacterium]